MSRMASGIDVRRLSTVQDSPTDYDITGSNRLPGGTTTKGNADIVFIVDNKGVFIMKYAQFIDRVIAGFIDYIVVIVCLVIISIITSNILFGYIQVAIFILIITISIFPINMLLNILVSHTYSNFIIFAIFFIIETLYYSIQELLIKRTIGFRCTLIGIEYQGEKIELVEFC